MITRPERTDRVTVAQTTIVIGLAGIGGPTGFTHTHDGTESHGQHGWLAWADAVVIECVAIVAALEARRDHAHRRSARLPLAVLVVSFVLQMTAQVAQAEPTPAGWLLAATPALGFLTVVKLVIRRAPTTAPAEPAHAEPAPVAPAPATAPPAPAPARVAPLPAAPVGSPALVRLPTGLRERVAELAHTAHAEGRPVTGEEIRTVVALPPHLLDGLTAELNASVNGHPG